MVLLPQINYSFEFKIVKLWADAYLETTNPDIRKPIAFGTTMIIERYELLDLFCWNWCSKYLGIKVPKPIKARTKNKLDPKLYMKSLFVKSLLIASLKLVGIQGNSLRGIDNWLGAAR